MKLNPADGVDISLEDDGRPVLVAAGERLPPDLIVELPAGDLAELLRSWAVVASALMVEQPAWPTGTAGLN